MNIVLHAFGRLDSHALLFLHGIGAGHRLWLRQIARFEQEHYIIAPDIPGLTGHIEDREIDFIAIACQLERALTEHGIRTVSICGISAGASMALALALQMQERVRHLILSAPQARAPRVGLALQYAIFSLMPERAIIAAMGKMLGNDSQIAMAAAEGCRALGKRGFLKAFRALWALDLREDLKGIQASTWVTCGGRDQMNIPAAREIAARISGAKLHIEPGAGHLWNVQMPERFNEMLEQVLRP